MQKKEIDLCLIFMTFEEIREDPEKIRNLKGTKNGTEVLCSYSPTQIQGHIDQTYDLLEESVWNLDCSRKIPEICRSRQIPGVVVII